ncbi:MAG: hypothetical protein HZC14_02570 [Candidatus Niyogibacteria bacterium]|nr:hypothetical protein [Candidatus Niyogibacteria bacterium]
MPADNDSKKDNDKGKKDIDALLSLELFESNMILEDSLAELDKLNSSFPITREFLKARGLTKVTELDKIGMRELTKHLKLTLRETLEKRFLAECGVQSRDELTAKDRLEVDETISKIMDSFKR